MQLQDLQTLVQGYVNEIAPSVGIGSATFLTSVINSAYDDVRNTIEGEDPEWFAAQTTMSYTAAAEFVALPAACQTNRILRVADTTDSSTDPRELMFLSAADEYLYTRAPSKWYTVTAGGVTAPDYYSLAGQNIMLIPKPTGARSLVIWYGSDKTNLVNPTDVPVDIPTRYHELIALRAAQRILAYDRRPSPAFDALASEQETKLLSFVGNRNTGQPSFVRFIDIDRP